jgi:thiol-disulfide isomerase/thioredoxin/mono/diheme cytochrome c family protein
MADSRSCRIILALLPCALFATQSVAAEDAGKRVDDFSLKSHLGREYALHDFADRKIVVLAFLGTECPLAKHYGPRLAELASKYVSKQVAFVAIDSNSQDSLAEMGAYARTSGIDFPFLKDLKNAVADRLRVTRTPEVLVLDKDRVVRYRGRIDDRCGVGYVRNKIEHDYLSTALDEILAGKPVQTTQVAAVGCLIGRSHAAEAKSDVTYSKQVARIFQDHCVSCHRPGEIGPFSLTSYKEAAGWADMIQEVVQEQRMPPWHANPKYGHFRNDKSLSAAEKETIQKWVAAGAPEGDAADLPEPRQFTAGWNLPHEPDLVLNVQKKPYKVQATGVVGYQNFVVDPGFKEDKWVSACQIIPGNAQVVHHVLCTVQEANRRNGDFDENGLSYLAVYVPGYRTTPFPKGMAKRIPAGAKLVFQMHYTPVGKEQSDLSKIGLIFANPKELTHMVETISTANRGFSIPPHAADYERESTMPPYTHELDVLSFMPHMHLRGKAFSYEAIYPNGKREMLLDVPHYDFNWQTNYELAEMKKLPAGTRVHCVAHWDNSENNLANPNPDVRIRWGDQTFEEMMIGFFDVAVPIDRETFLSKGVVPELAPVTSIEDRARDLISQFDVNGDGKLSKEELPEGHRWLFQILDRNKDGYLDLEEVAAFVKASSGKPAGRQPASGDKTKAAAPTPKPAGTK